MQGSLQEIRGIDTFNLDQNWKRFKKVLLMYLLFHFLFSSSPPPHTSTSLYKLPFPSSTSPQTTQHPHYTTVIHHEVHSNHFNPSSSSHCISRPRTRRSTRLRCMYLHDPDSLHQPLTPIIKPAKLRYRRNPFKVRY